MYVCTVERLLITKIASLLAKSIAKFRFRISEIANKHKNAYPRFKKYYPSPYGSYSPKGTINGHGILYAIMTATLHNIQA